MNASRLRLTTRLLLSALLCPLPAFATTVYRSVDEHGAVQFSDTPPAEPIPVDTLQINTTKPLQPEISEQRLREMRATSDRMAADRMARERHRAELRRLSAEADLNRAALDAATVAEERYSYEPYAYRAYAPLRRHRPAYAQPKPLPGKPSVHTTAISHHPYTRIRRGYSPQVRDFFNH